MCGRYTFTKEFDIICARWGVDIGEIPILPRYNIAPAQKVLAITYPGERRLEYMHWGLVPHWTKQLKPGLNLINARAETLLEKPSFKQAYLKRRCLILADSFYEWKQAGKTKIPMRILLKSREPFAFAGLWEYWRNPEGQEITSCAIITTSPNEVVGPIHNRMPVILARESEKHWLDSSITEDQLLRQFLVPYPGEEMEAYQVSDLVNSPKNDLPRCIERINDHTLFL